MFELTNEYAVNSASFLLPPWPCQTRQINRGYNDWPLSFVKPPASKIDYFSLAADSGCCCVVV